MTRRIECSHCGTRNHPGTPCGCGGPKAFSAEPVKRYNRRTSDRLPGCDLVKASDYERLEAALVQANKQHQADGELARNLTAINKRLTDQVKVLQSDENSWQSGYDKGRLDGANYMRREAVSIKTQVRELRALLTRCQELLDPHRDAVLWGDVCAALQVKP